MFLLGHIGLTVGLAEALRGRAAWLQALDPRWIAVGAMLPDLIDKPLGHWILDWGNGRLWGHTLLFALVLWAAWGLTIRQTQNPRGPVPILLAALAFGSTAHLLFDRMWELHATLLWPAFGWEMPRGHFEPGDWVTALLTEPYVWVTEGAGAVALGWAWSRTRARKAAAPA
ncbi:MAG TPA: metal-dependent hydrolase [Candidatus Thermoplasmatota archaeon]|nr:metal-dependent hydrolase [Candidatus Thermoplasmatota archaeon]